MCAIYIQHMRHDIDMSGMDISLKISNVLYMLLSYVMTGMQKSWYRTSRHDGYGRSRWRLLWFYVAPILCCNDAEETAFVLHAAFDAKVRSQNGVKK